MEKEDKSLRIKIMLKKKGITQRTLAQKLGMSPQSLSNRLNGDTPLDANLIVSLRPILGEHRLLHRRSHRRDRAGDGTQ